MSHRQAEALPTLGEFLDRARQAKDLSLTQLAEASGMTTPAVAGILKNEVAVPAPADLARLARALDLYPRDVFRHIGLYPLISRTDLDDFFRHEYNLPEDAIARINAIVDETAGQGDNL